MAWSLGGTISLLTVAVHPCLPVRSVTAVGTPLELRAGAHFDTVKASHLGLIAGPEAVSGTWPRIDTFLKSSPVDSASAEDARPGRDDRAEVLDQEVSG